LHYGAKHGELAGFTRGGSVRSAECIPLGALPPYLLVTGGHDMKLAESILAVATAVLMLAPMAPAQKDLSTSGIRFWVERADAIRMPETYDADNYFNSYQLGTNSFRGFTANGCHGSSYKPNCTQAIDGTAVWDATATDPSSSYHEDVLYGQLNNNPLVSWAMCGQWLNSTISYNGVLYGFSHGENPSTTDLSAKKCSDSSTHHKTMTLFTSADSGLTWDHTSPTLIIDSTDNNTGTTGESGEGDCNVIPGTTYAYLFCRHPSNTASDGTRFDTTGLARAPLSNLTSFVKYDSGWGSQPGVNGQDSDIPGYLNDGTDAPSSILGTSATYWKDKGWVMLLGVSDSKFNGVKISFTGLSNLGTNTVQFTTFRYPLMGDEGYYFKSNPTRNAYLYPAALNLLDGTRSFDLTQKGQFELVYGFVPHYNTLEQRILAMRSVTVTTSSTAQDPQVLVALTTRLDTSFNQRYSSTQPVEYGAEPYSPVSFSDVEIDTVGYLPQFFTTSPLFPASPTSQGQTLTKIVECTSTAPWPSGHPDHLITTTGCDASYYEDTVAGYSYPNQPATGNSVQIYRCTSTANGTHWVSASNTCEVNGVSLGKSEKSLGWILTK
jgi:hypothetical protein